MIATKKRIIARVWFLALIVFPLINMGTQALGASAEEIYASLAKLPEDKRQEAILKGAQKEAKFVMYGAHEEEQMNAMIQGFEKRYPGIKGEYLRGISDQIATKLLMEVRANRWYWDVAGSNSVYTELKQANGVAKHFGLVAEKNYPKRCIGEDWFTWEIIPVVIAFNTTMVKPSDAPKSYKELIDPKWKGNVSISAMPDNLLVAMIKVWGKEKTADWLDKLVTDNQSLIRQGHTAQTKMLGAGEFPVAAELYAYRTEFERGKGAPIDWVVPEDIAEAEIPGIVLSRNAPHPYAALLWAQYTTSRECANIVAKFGRTPLHAEAQFEYPRLKQLISGPSLERFTIITLADEKLYAVANEMIQKCIVPYIRGK